MSAPSIVVVRDLVKTFAARGALLRAVDGVSFDVGQGETLGLVGESGSGKSTTGRILVGLEAATSGSIKLFGREISQASGKAALGAVRRRLQFVMLATVLAGFWSMMSGTFFLMTLRAAGVLA